jgi:hypothetical protein
VQPTAEEEEIEEAQRQSKIRLNTKQLH